jgi:hypothetical protein
MRIDRSFASAAVDLPSYDEERPPSNWGYSHSTEYQERAEENVKGKDNEAEHYQ